MDLVFFIGGVVVLLGCTWGIIESLMIVARKLDVVIELLQRLPND